MTGHAPARSHAAATEAPEDGADETEAAPAPPAARPAKLSLLVERALVARLDRAAVTLARGLPGVRLDRAAAVRVLLCRALDVLERGSGDGEEPPETEAPSAEPLEGRVRAAVARLASERPGGTVSFEALRSALPDVAREALAAAVDAIRRADAGPETV